MEPMSHDAIKYPHTLLLGLGRPIHRLLRLGFPNYNVVFKIDNPDHKWVVLNKKYQLVAQYIKPFVKQDVLNSYNYLFSKNRIIPLLHTCEFKNVL